MALIIVPPLCMLNWLQSHIRYGAGSHRRRWRSAPDICRRSFAQCSAGVV